MNTGSIAHAPFSGARMQFNPAQRKFLKAQAHPLKAVVWIGRAGLTEAVLAEIDRALAAHELIKVRVQNDDRAVREAWLAEICSRLGCGVVQHLGKQLWLYRPTEPARLRPPTE